MRPTLELLEERDVPTVTLAGQVTFDAGTGATNVMVGDFNGDSRPDMAVSNIGSNSVSIFLNTMAIGATTTNFSGPQTFAVGAGPRYGAVGDINGDGRVDIIIPNRESNTTISVLLNTTTVGASSASFATQRTFTAGVNPYAVALADVNGDGRLDLAVANYVSDTLSVLLNTTTAGATTPSFSAQQTFSVGYFPTSVAVADFNGDGRPDFAVANNGADTLSVLLNTTAAGANTPSFAAQSTFTAGTGPVIGAVGDFNSDGRPDLAVSNLSTNTFSLLRNTTIAGATAPTFAAHQTFTVGANAYGVGVGDFNGDGRSDLAISNRSSNTLSVRENTTAVGASTFSFATQITFAVGSEPTSTTVADFNGDGRPDIVTSNLTANNVSVLRNTTTPFANTIPSVAVAFPGQGVWQYNRTQGWQQLASANASMVACNARGAIVANLTGYGLWLYRASTGWQSLNTPDASAVAIDANGNVTANLPGHGIYLFRPASGWQSLNTVDANLIAVDALGNIYATFSGYGIWRFRPAAGWQQIGSGNASQIAVNAKGDLVANFTGAGIYLYRPYTGWTSLMTLNATALTIDANGNVAASFTGYGVYLYRPTIGWILLSATSATLLNSDASGNIYGQFTGYGVIVYAPTQGWVRHFTGDISKLFVA